MTNLQTAAALIQEFADTLNVSGKMCDACKRMHYDNHQEYQLHFELVAMINKLNNIPRRLAGTKGSKNEHVPDKAV